MKSTNKLKIIMLVLLFCSCSKQNTAEADGKSKLEGVWMTYSADYPAVPNIQANWICFFNNGKSLTTIPDNGLNAYDINSETSPIDLGNYTFTGSNGKNTIGNSVSTLSLVKDDELKVDNRTYYKCASVNNLKLNGSYTTYQDPSDPNLQTLPYGQNPKIEFDLNGNFNDWGIYNTLVFNFLSDPDIAKPGGGTYEIKNFSLLLHYTDGREKSESINQFLKLNDANPDILYIRKIDLRKIP